MNDCCKTVKLLGFVWGLKQMYLGLKNKEQNVTKMPRPASGIYS